MMVLQQQVNLLDKFVIQQESIPMTPPAVVMRANSNPEIRHGLHQQILPKSPTTNVYIFFFKYFTVQPLMDIKLKHRLQRTRASPMQRYRRHYPWKTSY